MRETERCLLREVGHLDAQIQPSPTASWISLAVSPTMMPTSVIPASRMDQAVEQNRLVGNRHQLLCRRVGDGA